VSIGLHKQHEALYSTKPVEWHSYSELTNYTVNSIVNSTTSRPVLLRITFYWTSVSFMKRPRVQYFYLPAAIVDIEPLDCCNLLGVLFQWNF